MAVGFYATGNTGNPLPMQQLSESWNGTAWEALATPAHPGSIGAALSGVSCVSASACAAAGGWVDRSGTEMPLAEIWNGSRWTVTPVPVPSKAISPTSFFGVSCTSESACVAVGSYQVENNRGFPLIDVWDGTGWRLQRSPLPSQAFRGGLTSVSCVSATECTAAGVFDTTHLALAWTDEWNGTAWRAARAPSPTRTSAVGFSHVSCVPAGACIAVGTYFKYENTPLLPLAEGKP